MKAKLWGVRGSMPTPGAATARYGGNTSCVEIRPARGHLVVLDAGTGIVPLGHGALGEERIDILLTHLHLDHIQGLAFFAPLFRPDLEVHVWGPPSTTLDLRTRLTRYLSPPLFPVRLRDLPCRLTLHDLPIGRFAVPGLDVEAALVCHPGPTVAYRLTEAGRTLAYFSDHEPALGSARFPHEGEWTSGFDIAHGAHVLIHDSQYTEDVYRQRIGWGHSSIADAVAFAELAGVGTLVAFHHDPAHDDAFLDDLAHHLARSDGLEVRIGREGDEFVV